MNRKSLSFKNDNGEKIAVVYRPELALFLMTADVPGRFQDAKKKTSVNGRSYIAHYTNGFDEGTKHFESNFKANPDTIYGNNVAMYIRGLHHNYFHQCDKSKLHGWKYWRDSYPLVVSSEIIREYGFYCGLVYSVETLAEKHPAIFKGFDKCDLSEKLPGKKNAPKSGKRDTTITRRKNYFETYQHFVKIEKVGIKEAMRRTIEKHGISQKTLDRAISDNTP